jgi:KUP system potassium uptake protein
MFIWFVAIAVMRLFGILRHPAIFLALNPAYGFDYLFNHGAGGFFAIGAVFLCVTGAEALYADMGHFGAGPIRFSWFCIVFPSLILNYAGHAALVAEARSNAPTDDNIFYRLLYPRKPSSDPGFLA